MRSTFHQLKPARQLTTTNHRETNKMPMKKQDRKSGFAKIIDLMLKGENKEAFSKLTLMCAEDTGLFVFSEYDETIRKNAEKAKSENPNQLKEDAFNALQTAVTALHDYACSCEIGDERTKAFAIYQAARRSPIAEG